MSIGTFFSRVLTDAERFEAEAKAFVATPTGAALVATLKAKLAAILAQHNELAAMLEALEQGEAAVESAESATPPVAPAAPAAS